MNYKAYSEEIQKYIKGQEGFFKTFIAGELFNVTSTYGYFDTEEFKDVNPLEYFTSQNYKSHIKESYLGAVSSSKGISSSVKEVFEDDFNDFLDNIGFFGTQKLADNIVDAVLFNNYGMRFNALNAYTEIKDSLKEKGIEVDEFNFEFFKQEFKDHLGAFIEKQDKSKVLDLCVNIEVDLMLSPLEKADFAEESVFFMYEDILVPSEENVEILKDLGISKEEIEEFYQEKLGMSLEKIDEELQNNENGPLPIYQEFELNTKNSKQVSFSEIYYAVKDKNTALPVFVYNDRLHSYLDKDNIPKDSKVIFCLLSKEGVIPLKEIKTVRDLRIQDMQYEYLNFGFPEVEDRLLNKVSHTFKNDFFSKLKIG